MVETSNDDEPATRRKFFDRAYEHDDCSHTAWFSLVCCCVLLCQGRDEDDIRVVLEIVIIRKRFNKSVRKCHPLHVCAYLNRACEEVSLIELSTIVF